jgi:tripartite-type tricarboxylate transporter receptor subunit TctC
MPLVLTAAQIAYPRRPITVIVPFPAGGTTDRSVRALTRIAAPDLGQLFVIENRPGASTLLAAHALVRARSDGYTIGVVPLALNRLKALGKTTLDVANDFSFIARIAGQTHGIVVRSDSPYQALGDVVRAAHYQPGQLTYATSGVASHTHVAVEDFASRAGIELRHIPFKGGVESLTALRAGLIDFLAESPVWLADVDAARCRLLSTWNEQRVARFPTVPTMKELGYPLAFEGSIGLGGPVGIALPVLERLRQVFRQAILSREFADECDALLAPVLYLDGDAFRAFSKENFGQELELVRRLGGKLLG